LLLREGSGGNAKATTAAPKTRERDREREEEKEREREEKLCFVCFYFSSRGGSQTGRRARAKEYIFATTRTTKRDRRENIYREIK